MGQAVSGIAYDDFSALGLKKLGKITFTPPGGRALWLTRDEARKAGERWGWKWDESWDFWEADGRGGCPWAGHGV